MTKTSENTNGQQPTYKQPNSKNLMKSKKFTINELTTTNYKQPNEHATNLQTTKNK